MGYPEDTDVGCIMMSFFDWLLVFFLIVFFSVFIFPSVLSYLIDKVCFLISLLDDKK